MLRPGAQIGNYIVESELGSGGMARIYRVRHAVLQTEHALKVLEPASWSARRARLTPMRAWARWRT